MTAEDSPQRSQAPPIEPEAGGAAAQWSPSPSELEAFAGRVCYEVERALLQSLDPMMREGRANLAHHHDALVESTLGHLRALDRFFRHDTTAPPSVSWAARRTVLHADSIVARHYIADWPRTGFLGRHDRTAINARLTPLAGRPALDEVWDMGRMALDLGRTFLDFVDRLDERGRAWFARTRSIVIREMANTKRGARGPS
jgi:hypothetical protein